MVHYPLPRPNNHGRRGREATVADIVETIDRHAPSTKADLAEHLDISEQYLSEILQDLKRIDVVRKGYVLDDDALHREVDVASRLFPTDGADELENRRTGKLLELLERLNDVTRSQYEAAQRTFTGDEPEESSEQLEGLANERHTAIFEELKSYTLATEWPANRLAADLATVATNLEIVGDRACFIEDVVDNRDLANGGAITERVLDIFRAGEDINDHMSAILFDGAIDRHDTLRSTEETLHRDLDEVLELITAYDPEMYGYLLSVTRALERAIFYWVHTAELAVRLHSGRDPEHIAMT